jgi:hypothetical protein
VERVRRRGWADAFEEREIGLKAIAAPVWASDGALAGIIAAGADSPLRARGRTRCAADPPGASRCHFRRARVASHVMKLGVRYSISRLTDASRRWL